jgi:endoglucanase
VKKIILCLAGFALFALTGLAQPSRVGVQGNHFVTADGNVIIFRGLDTSDPDKLERDGQWNKHYFEMAKSWGANFVRFPVHPAMWRICGQKNYLKLLDQGFEWAREEGLYVIIDRHGIGNLHEEKFSPARRS